MVERKMAWMRTVDDLGVPLELQEPPRRIVSLVPSWTETLFAFGCGSEIAGVTRFCIEPAAAVASVVKIGGTKNPDVPAILALRPDLVIANAEENRREDIERIRAGGVAVFTTYPRSIAAAVEAILKLGAVVGRPAEAGAMAREIVRSVSEIETGLGAWNKLRFRVFCPIWKNPWMVFNGDTYAHDVLRMAGFNNIYAPAGERYPRTTLAAALELRPDYVLLPNEPYEFGAKDVDELKPLLPPALSRRVVLIDGRDLHWYGVHMVDGLKSLAALLARVRAATV
ncbi:MAG: ABC transporter substrate-binding protein [Candidatus Binataceae bacterium]|nr:ABC transporter substrate-binding protein [Candidatus Binataceae bacterium]